MAGRLDVVTLRQLNANARKGHERWLEHGGRRDHVVFGQELKVPECEIRDFDARAHKLGWRASVAPCTTMGSGDDARRRSAGAFVASPPHVGSQVSPMAGRADLSPLCAPGRIALRAVDILGGMDCLSVYLFDTEGWSDRNVELARAVSFHVRSSSRRWAVGLDGNMEPGVFAEHPAIVSTKGVVVAAQGGTCGYKEIWKSYDYYLVHPALKSLVTGIEVLMDWPTYPHQPVRLTLRGDAAKLLKRIAVAPRPLPVAPPIGCRRQPPSWPLSTAVWDPRLPEQEQTQSFADAHAAVRTCLESEVLDRCDIVDPEQRQKYIGRGRELDFAVVPLLQPRKSREVLPWYSQDTLGARLELDELGRVMFAIQKAGDGEGGSTVQLWKQRAAVIRRLERRQRWLRKSARSSDLEPISQDLAN